MKALLRPSWPGKLGPKNWLMLSHTERAMLPVSKAYFFCCSQPAFPSQPHFPEHTTETSDYQSPKQ